MKDGAIMITNVGDIDVTVKNTDRDTKLPPGAHCNSDVVAERGDTGGFLAAPVIDLRERRPQRKGDHMDGRKLRQVELALDLLKEALRTPATAQKPERQWRWEIEKVALADMELVLLFNTIETLPKLVQGAVVSSLRCVENLVDSEAYLAWLSRHSGDFVKMDLHYKE